MPQEVVEQSLESVHVLGDCVTSSYIRIPQPGFQDCYSTQRKITSAVSLAELPYFIPLKFEGVSYRTCLFVPGREPICFKCGLVGHMRGQCSTSKSGPVQAQKPVATPVASVSDVEEELSIQVPVGLAEKQCASSPPPREYEIWVNSRPITFQGKVSKVAPPTKSLMAKSVQDVESLKCSHDNCRLLTAWFKGGLSFWDIYDHLTDSHDEIEVCVAYYICLPVSRFKDYSLVSLVSVHACLVCLSL